MRVVIAGGGTGGHVIPALAIAQELRDRHSAQVIFIGTARGMETKLVPAAGFELRLVRSGQLKRVSLLTRLRTFFDLPIGIFESWRFLLRFRPDVVIGVGGYASGPAMLAAVFSRIPTLVFEPNYVPGFANRVLAPFVSAAAVQFPHTGRRFRRFHLTGVPVRREFFQVGEVPRPGRPTLLVFGGSQGARVINRTMLDSLHALWERVPGIHVIHQTGERDYNEARAAYLRPRISAEIHPFIEQMPEAFARADLLVCRSGASTVAEVTAAGKPAIFIPFAQASDDHQLRNAEALARHDAAIVLRESELTPGRLVEAVASLLNDRARLARMGTAAKAIARPNAAAEIAALAVQLAGRERTTAAKA